MAIREIITVPDPRLKEISRPIEKVDHEIRLLMDDMLETMYDAPGIGLAAIQIAVPLRVIVMDLQEKPDDATDPEAEGVKNPRFFANPEIIWASSELSVYDEGCLSVPEYFDNVERPAEVIIKYLNYHGEMVEEKATGLFATCIQHEMDHLNGVLFIDHLSRLKRERAVAKVKKNQRLA